jgi:hypothetical protein
MAMLPLFTGFFRVLYSGWPDAPNPSTAENSDIISYRDNVPTFIYWLGGLALSLFVFLVWVIISSTQHHAARPEIFILYGVMGWLLCFKWMHMCLTGRYPEVPYIWCDTQTVSIDRRCRIPWKRLVTITPILRTHRNGQRSPVGVTLGYTGAKGLETLNIRNPRASSDMGTICEDLRERAVAGGAVLHPLNHSGA